MAARKAAVASASRSRTAPYRVMSNSRAGKVGGEMRRRIASASVHSPAVDCASRRPGTTCRADGRGCGSLEKLTPARPRRRAQSARGYHRRAATGHLSRSGTGVTREWVQSVEDSTPKCRTTTSLRQIWKNPRGNFAHSLRGSSMTLAKRALGSVALAMCLMAVPATAHAAPVVISAAQADVPNGMVFIHGEEFGTFMAPVVVLDGFVLTVTNWGPNDLIALLPAPLATVPASYRLAVTRRGKAGGLQDSAEFVLTIGSTGPAGPPVRQGRRVQRVRLARRAQQVRRACRGRKASRVRPARQDRRGRLDRATRSP